MLDREIREAGQVSRKRGVEVNEKRFRPRLDHRPKGRLELVGPACPDDLDLDPKRPRRLRDDLDRGE